MIGVGSIQSIGLPNANVHCEGITFIPLRRIVRFSIDAYELREEWIWAGRIPGCVRHTNDVLVSPLGEARGLSELWIGQLLAKALGEVGPASVLAVEPHAETLDLALLQCLLLNRFTDKPQLSRTFHEQVPASGRSPFSRHPVAPSVLMCRPTIAAPTGVSE